MTRCGSAIAGLSPFVEPIARAVTLLVSEVPRGQHVHPEKILFLLSAFWKDLISRKSSPAPDEGDDGSKALPER